MALLEPNGYGTLGFNGCWFSEQAQLLCTTVFREQINVRKVSQDTIMGTFNQNWCATGLTSDVTVRRCFVVRLTTNHPANAFYYTVQRQQISLQGDFCKLSSDKSCLNRLKGVRVDYIRFTSFSLFHCAALTTRMLFGFNCIYFKVVHISVLWNYHEKKKILLLKADNNR